MDEFVNGKRSEPIIPATPEVSPTAALLQAAEPLMRVLLKLEGDNPSWYGDESTVMLRTFGSGEYEMTLGDLRKLRAALKQGGTQ